jgi:hypothetical protein
MSWNQLLVDEYVSPVFDELHARLENYQIYSIVICDHIASARIDDHDFGLNLPDVPIGDRLIITPTSIPANEFPDIYFDPLPDVITVGVVYPRLGHAPGFRIYTKLTTAPGFYPGFSYGVVLDGYNSVTQDAAYLSDGYSVIYSQSVQNFTWFTGNDFQAPYPLISSVHIELGFTNYPNLLNHAASVTSSALASESATNTAIACQSFDPVGAIPFDFVTLADIHPIQKPGTITYNAVPARFLGFSESYDLTGGKADYRDLIFGHPQDPRSLPSNILATATTTRIISFGYYRRNRFESHPKLLASLDWRLAELQVTAGKPYRLPLIDPVLGTLVVDTFTRAEIIAITAANTYPVRFLFADQLADLFTYWNTFYPPPPPLPPAPTYPLASSITLTQDLVEPAATKQVIATTYTPVVRALAANNDRWGHGTITTAKNRPLASHPVFQFDHQRLFEELQFDYSYGSYMTDSPRLREIHAALDAAIYALDPVGGGTRKANLGWMIIKIGEILGIRRQPNGKFLTTVEAKKYERTRANSPNWTNPGDYALDAWGKFGLAFRYLPTAYKDGQRQDNQFDMVHDLPQLLAAVLDQIDHSQGIQHSAQIRIPVGKQIQAYPNQGAAVVDTAARIIQLERMIEQLLVMQIETSNSVREIFPGVGIPVTTKTARVDVGGQIRDIHYPGYQQSKPSVSESIGSLKTNIGIILGALMPRKAPKKNPLNPWNRE